MDNLALSDDSTALYAFSADPITYGHINIVERMVKCFSHCIVGIGRNPMKQYLFSLEEREQMAKAALAHIPNVEVMSFEGMVVDFAFEHGAKVIIKGVRSANDLEYEQTLHQVGVSQNMGIDTHILFSEPHLAHVSSSVVKGMQTEHGFIHQYVPPVVKAGLEARLSQQLVIGLTGDIAAGKSTLASDLISAGECLGITVHNIDLDALGHQILSGKGIGEPMHRKFMRDIAGHFGTGVFVETKVDRKLLAEKIFNDKHARDFLNGVISKPLSILLRRALKGKKGIVLLNGALLPDMGMLELCNFRCILCEVGLEEQTQRLFKRGLSADQIEGRLVAQMNSEEKLNAIRNEIGKNNFGAVWRYSGDGQTPKELLESIIESCKECTWKN